MQLSLRTLLDYLDDALEPAQTRAIGQQIADDPQMQELISRIRQVTRRRRLTTPPNGPNHPRFEAHTVAAYLDGSLPDSDAKALEEICMESDVHLAELASCHQILTLAMGEPALVPPPAVKRMYGLVKGKETTPGRKPAVPARRRALAENHDVDDGQAGRGSDGARAAAASAGDGYGAQPGMTDVPQYPAWLRWALPLAVAAVLLAVLGVFLWPKRNDLLSDPNIRQARLKTVADKDGSRSASTPSAGQSQSQYATSASESSSVASSSRGGSSASVSSSPSPSSGSASGSSSGSASTSPIKIKPWIDQPSTSRVQIGKVGAGLKKLPFMLVGRPAEVPNADPWQGWERLSPEAPVRSSDTLMALPGFRSNLVLDKGVDILLWGNVPPFFMNLPLLESAIVLHDNPDYDVDLTLLRGRIIITNHKTKGPATIRIRFYNERERKEAWDLTLQQDTEVGIERVGGFRTEDPFDPRTGVPPVILASLVMLKGEAKARLDEFRHWSLQAPGPGAATTPALVSWDNIGRGADVRPVDKETLKYWDDRAIPTDKAAQAMLGSMDRFDKDFKDKKPLNIVAKERSEDPGREGRYLGVYCLGAIDNVPALLDALGDPNENRQEKRDAASVALQSWICRQGGNDLKVYDILVNAKRYSKEDASVAMQLLHGISREAKARPETWDWLIQQLKNDKPAIGYLAYLRLYSLVSPEVVKSVKQTYNPAADKAQKEAVVRAWKDVIPDGKVPPQQE